MAVYSARISRSSLNVRALCVLFCDLMARPRPHRRPDPRRLGAVAVMVAVWVANMVAEDGESNWLEGALLLAVYVILGMAFFFLP